MQKANSLEELLLLMVKRRLAERNLRFNGSVDDVPDHLAGFILAQKPFEPMSEKATQNFVKIRGMLNALDPATIDSAIVLVLAKPPEDTPCPCGEDHDASESLNVLTGMVSSLDTAKLLFKVLTCEAEGDMTQYGAVAYGLDSDYARSIMRNDGSEPAGAANHVNDRAGAEENKKGEDDVPPQPNDEVREAREQATRDRVEAMLHEDEAHDANK